MKFAIFRKDIGNYSETFVRKNIETLNEGRTVVVCERFTDPMSWRPKVPTLRLAYFPKPLRGAAVSLFLRRHGVSSSVCEFLDFAAYWAPLLDRMRIPYVALGHGYDIGRNLKKFGDYARFLERLKSARKIIVPCEAGKTALLARANFEPTFIESVPVGIDLAQFSEPNLANRPEEFIFVGRFVEKKAPVCLILAFHKALQQRPGMLLHCVGDGPLAPAARQLARCLGMSDRIKFHGALPHQEVLSMVRSMRGALQHSVTAENGDMETMPLSIQEALAAGTPAVVSRHAGLPDIVTDNVTGYLVNEFDIDAMAQGILKLAAASPADYRMMQQAARRDSARFDYRIRVRRIESLLSPPGL